jgi:hypothetical protein
VPKVMLQGPRVVAVVRELETTGMTEHVEVDWEGHLGGLAEALDEPMERRPCSSVGNRAVTWAMPATRQRGSGPLALADIAWSFQELPDHGWTLDRLGRRLREG